MCCSPEQAIQKSRVASDLKRNGGHQHDAILLKLYETERNPFLSNKPKPLRTLTDERKSCYWLIDWLIIMLLKSNQYKQITVMVYEWSVIDHAAGNTEQISM